MSSFQATVLRNQTEILARLRAMDEVDVAPRAPKENGTWDDTGLWDSTDVVPPPPVQIDVVPPPPTQTDAASVESRLALFAKGKCQYDPCFKGGVTDVRDFGSKCKANGGQLMLSTRDGLDFKDASLDAFVDEFTKARANGAPLAKCEGASVASWRGRKCEAWNLGVERCFGRS